MKCLQQEVNVCSSVVRTLSEQPLKCSESMEPGEALPAELLLTVLEIR